MAVRGAEDGRRKKGTGARSLKGERVKSLLKDMEHDPSLANALLVMLGALFLLTSFNFYPWWLLPIILAGLGLIAYKFAPLGTLLGVLLAFPAIAYQSPVLAWVYMLVMAITMFYTFTSWHIISALMILILAPFTSVPFLAGIVIPLLMLSALLLGSKHSIQLTLPCVFVVLLLSAVWHTDACREGLSACSSPSEYAQDNGAFMPIRKDVSLFEMRPGFSHLQRSDRPAPQGFNQMLEATTNSFGSLLSGDTIKYMNEALGAVFNAIIRLLFYDSALIQIFFWCAAVFLVPFISGRTRHPRRNLIASFSFVLIPVGYFVACMVSEASFNPIVFAYIVFSVFLAGLLEYAKINLSREIAVGKAEKAAQFGKFGLQDLSTSAGTESLSDVGGYESTKQELQEAIVWPIRRRDLSNVYGIKPPKGILLFGPPGTGKTMLMRALAKELEIGFYYVKCSDLLSEWYGESEKNITELFKVARKASPCVLFFDEIDSIGKSRDAYTADDVAPRVLSLLLSEIDGFKTEKNVIMIGATNVPNQLDHALLRPGRFDKIIYMPLPDKRARLEIFLIHTKNMPVADDVDFNKLAEMTERYSGADIQNICTEAARKAARDASVANMVVPVTMSHFVDCIDDIKPSVSLAKLEEYEQFRLDYERRAVGTEVREEKIGKVGWDDVAGLESVKKALIEAIEIPLLHEDLIKQYKVKPSKGVLLFGPPGCGKTLIVRAAANELKVTFITLSGADLLKKGYEGAVQLVKETFNRARERAPSVIFMDEIEAIAPSRDSTSSQLVENVVSQLLTELDGVKELKKVVLIGATNRPDSVDKALMRPGRFDKIVFIPPPNAEVRERILALNLENIPIADGVDLKKIAKRAEGFSGADLASICQEAKMRLVRRRLTGEHEPVLNARDFEEILGERRPSITARQLEEYLEFRKEYGERK